MANNAGQPGTTGLMRQPRSRGPRNFDFNATTNVPNEADRIRSRRVALGWLCSLQAGAGIVGGAVTFALRPHDWAVVASNVQVHPVGAALALSLNLAVIACAGVIYVSYGGYSQAITSGAALVLAIPTYGVVRSIADGADPGIQIQVLAYQTIFCLALISLRPTIEDLKVVGGVGVAIAVTALLFALLLPENAYMPEGWNEKLFPSLPVLAGPFNHSNNLGLLLAFCAPFTLLMTRKWWKWTAFLLIAGVIVLSASRTAMLAVGVSLAVFLVCQLWPGASRLIASLSLMIAGALVVVVPLATEDPHEYSDRGMIWTWTFDQYHSSGDYIWGASSAWPDRLNEYAPATSAHNLFAHWLFIGGVALLAFGIILIVTYASRTVRMLPGTVPLVAILYMLTLLILSVAEYLLVLTPGSPYFLATFVPLVCVLTQPRRERAPRPTARRPTSELR